MTTAPTTTQATDVQQIGAVVEYHGTHESRHGRYLTSSPWLKPGDSNQR